jgi:hypothetical protein
MSALVFVCCAVFVFGQNAGPIDLILLLDTSSSMSASYGEVNNYMTGGFLREFLRIGDTFHLIAFSDKPRVDIARRVEGRGDLETIIGRMLLQYPLDPWSDIPAALGFAETYASSLPSRPKKIVFISDGDTAPAPGSASRPLDAAGLSALIGDLKTRLGREGISLDYIRVAPGQPLANLPRSGRTPMAAPGQSAPAQSARPPAQAAAPPAQTTPPPAQASAPPAQAAAPPTQTTPPPAQTTPPPAQASAPPAQTTPPPAQASVPPAQTTAPPAQTTPPPAQTSAPPAQTIPPPAQTTPPPAQTTPPPAQTAAPPIQTSEPPAQTTPAPGEASSPPSVSAPAAPSPAEVPPARPSEPARPGQGIQREGFPLLAIGLALLGLVIVGLIVFLVTRRLQGGPSRAMAMAAAPAPSSDADLPPFKDHSKDLADYAASQSRQRTTPYTDRKPAASSSPIQTVEFSGGPLLVNMFVEDQNTLIGKRNIHALKSGYGFTIGGGKSDFLIFLVSLPSAIGEVRRDGNRCFFIPRKAKYFPDLGSSQLPDCIGKTIRVVSDKNYEIRFRLERYEDPLQSLNRMLNSVKVPG